VWHGVLVTLHAVAGVIAFGAGCDAVVRRRWFAVFWWSLVAMVAFLALAVAAEWSSLDSVTRPLFTGLLALGALMVLRAWLAGRILSHAPQPDEDGGRRYVRHVAFNLVALFDAFVVVTVLNGGIPGWATAVVGVTVAVAGHFVARDLERRFGLRSAVTDGCRPFESPSFDSAGNAST
jgi:hypothetical protein